MYITLRSGHAFYDGMCVDSTSLHHSTHNDESWYSKHFAQNTAKIVITNLYSNTMQFFQTWRHRSLAEGYYYQEFKKLSPLLLWTLVTVLLNYWNPVYVCSAGVAWWNAHLAVTESAKNPLTGMCKQTNNFFECKNSPKCQLIVKLYCHHILYLCG